MGIAGVGATATSIFKAGDTCRFNAIVTGMQNDALVPFSDHPLPGDDPQSITNCNHSSSPAGPSIIASSPSPHAASPLNGNFKHPLDNLTAENEFERGTKSLEQAFLTAPSISTKVRTE